MDEALNQLSSCNSEKLFVMLQNLIYCRSKLIRCEFIVFFVVFFSQMPTTYLKKSSVGSYLQCQ